MRIIFLSRNVEICHIISQQLQGHSCFVFSDESLFYEVLENSKELPNLLVLEYQAYNHDIYNIYDQYKEKHIFIPTIFYNDPCIVGSTRAYHWKKILEITKRQWEEFNYDEYFEVFKVIEKVVEDPLYAPYIPLMQKSKPLPKSMHVTKLNPIENYNDVFTQIMRFKRSSKMSERLFKMMECFYTSLDQDLSPEDIQQKYHKNGSDLKIESIKVRISELKNFFKNTENCPFALIRRNKKYRMVMF